MARDNARAPEYNAWLNMTQRCHNPKHFKFPEYGGRGISVCQEWRDSFTAFYTDMGVRPSSHHTLERVDNDGPYNAENCCWALMKTQARNKRSNRLLTLNGTTLTVTDWARKRGIDPRLVFARLRAGWSDEQAITKKSR